MDHMLRTQLITSSQSGLNQSMSGVGPPGTWLLPDPSSPSLTHISLILTIPSCLSSPLPASYMKSGLVSDGFPPTLSAEPIPGTKYLLNKCLLSECVTG